MHRSILPNILITLGYLLLLLGSRRPVFEWQISDVTTDLAPAYEVHISPYPLTTSLGRSLEDISYYGRILVSRDGEICDASNLTFEAKRSQNRHALEQIILVYFSDENISWLFQWIARGFVLSIIYVWLITIWYKRPIGEAIILTVLGGSVFLFLSQIVRPLLWTVGPSFGDFGNLACAPSTITFNIALSKVHYETLLVWLFGLLAEIVALVIIVRQVMQAIIKRKTASNSHKTL